MKIITGLRNAANKHTFSAIVPFWWNLCTYCVNTGIFLQFVSTIMHLYCNWVLTEICSFLYKLFELWFWNWNELPMVYYRIFWISASCSFHKIQPVIRNLHNTCMKWISSWQYVYVRVVLRGWRALKTRKDFGEELRADRGHFRDPRERHFQCWMASLDQRDIKPVACRKKDVYWGTLMCSMSASSVVWLNCTNTYSSRDSTHNLLHPADLEFKLWLLQGT